MSLKYPHSNLHIGRLCGPGSKVDKLPFVFSSSSPTFASHKLINDKIPEGTSCRNRRIKTGKKQKQSFQSRGFWQLEMRLAPLISFTSTTQPPQLDFFLICLFSAISFSSLHSINDPGGLAGFVRSPVSQDWRCKRGSKTIMLDLRPASWHVCVYVCVL